MPESILSSNLMSIHLNFLYAKITEMIRDQPKTNQQWSQSFNRLNTFLISDQYVSSIKMLFESDSVTKVQNKFSTKLALWLLEKEIAKRADSIVKKQAEKVASMEIDYELSSAAKEKIRYLAGACLQRISKRIRESVLRSVGKSSKKSRTIRKLEYKKQAMLRNFRISEQDVDVNDDSMIEIESKQGSSRGLTIVDEPMYNFFVMLNQETQKNLSKEHFHIHYEDLHTKCREAVDSNNQLVENWISLFENGDPFDNSEIHVEDEIFLTLIMELYRDITEYFIRIAFVDALRQFKMTK